MSQPIIYFCILFHYITLLIRYGKLFMYFIKNLQIFHGNVSDCLDNSYSIIAQSMKFSHNISLSHQPYLIRLNTCKIFNKQSYWAYNRPVKVVVKAVVLCSLAGITPIKDSFFGISNRIKIIKRLSLLTVSLKINSFYSTIF